VGQQRAQAGLGRRRGKGEPPQPRGQGQPEPQPAGRGLHVALHARDLPGQEHAGPGPQLQLGRERHWRVDKSVAVRAAQPLELGLLQPRDHPKDALLLGVRELGLAAHQIEHGLPGVLGPQLDHGESLAPRARVGQAHGLERPVRQGQQAGRGQGLDGHAALKVQLLLEVPRRRGPASQQRLDKGEVLLPVHGAVQVVELLGLVARPPKRLGHVHGLRGHDGRDGVIEIEVLGPHDLGQGPAQAVRGQRPCGDDDAPRVGQGRVVQACDLSAFEGHPGPGLDLGRDPRREAVAVHGQGLARWDAGRLGRGDDQGAQGAHLLLEQPDRRLGFVRA